MQASGSGPGTGAADETAQATTIIRANAIILKKLDKILEKLEKILVKLEEILVKLEECW